MVGWWPFDVSADDVIAANHGTLQGGASIVSGKVSNAVSLDGVDDYVSIPASAGLDTQTAITIDAWIFPAAAPAPVVEYSFGSSAFGVHLWIHTDDDVFANFVDATGGDHVVKSGVPMTLNEWHHIAATYDKTSGFGAVYLDGVSVFGETLGSFDLATSADLYIGHRPLTGEQFPWFAGLIDEVEIFNRALTADEIQDIYNAGSDGKCLPTVSMWKATPASGDWHTPSNWTPSVVPVGAGDTARFRTSTITNVSLSRNIAIGSTIFLSGASAYLINILPYVWEFIGTGVTNSSSVVQNFVVGAGARLHFKNTASAGNLTTYTIGGANLPGNLGGSIEFHNSSKAGRATVIANGGSNGGGPGTIEFRDTSTGGTASVVLNGGNLAISFRTAPGVTIGSLEGDTGAVLLGDNKLTVGGLNTSTSFSGNITDSFFNSPLAGGSLTKVGTGALTLGGDNTYTGGTTVNAGSLLLEIGDFSQTGTGNVTVTAGLIGGNGRVGGDLTIGNNSGPRAILAPGFPEEAIPQDRFIVEKKLAFRSDADFVCQFDSSQPRVDHVSARGVAISPGATFSFSEVGTGMIPIGTTFILLINTAHTPISGTFTGVPEGAQLVFGNYLWKFSYLGHTGFGNNSFSAEVLDHLAP
jgi:autotransporter-associated beta strand protein